MSLSGKYLLILFLIILGGKDLFAQFTYGGIRLSYYNARFDSKDNSSEENLSRINDLVVNLDLIHRPIRNLGVGISTRFPIVEGFRYSYRLDEDYHTSKGGTLNYEEPTLASGDFDYNISLKSSITFFTRVFFSTETNLFLDIRYTLEKYNETFSYVREGNTDLPSENISRNNTIKGSGIGFAAGHLQKIGDHFYLTAKFGIDFIKASSSNLAVIEVSDYSSSNKTKPLTIPSKIEDSTTLLEFSYGIGYTF